LILTLTVSAVAQVRSPAVTAEDYARAEGFLRDYTEPLVYGATDRRTWLPDDRLWYRDTIPQGSEFILVDPATRRRARTFDHARLARALSSAADTTYEAFDLPFITFEFSQDGGSITFEVKRRTYTCDLSSYRCRADEGQSAEKKRNMMVSPDGRLAAFIRDYNLWTRELDSGKETQLTTDGQKDFAYATNNAGWIKSDRPVLSWSPDSKKIATFQHDARGVGEMYLVSTAVGHPELQAWKYPLPGDSLIFRMHRVVIHLNGPRVVRLQMPPDPHRSTISDHVADRSGSWLDVEWSDDASQLAFVSSSRDHKQAQLRVSDPETGRVRDVLEETVDTFFESGYRKVNWHVLKSSNEVIWFSQRDNWGHLYLFDLKTGRLTNRITSGAWNVLQLLRIDQESRTLYFTGSGREPGDPYFQYLYRVQMDGSDLKLLTPERANHSVSISSSGRYFVDSYSTPVSPPITLLRDRDGRQIQLLERADISQLVATGWQAPIQITVKARDGQTDLHGLMYKPTNFDPSKSYPVLNYVYPGPQSGSVGSRAFSASRRDKQALAELGFIVVEVDAMGTPMRSKSFHEAYYGNMGDNGIPDQIAALKELAQRHPWMELNRVGIWGH
jgi:dipeptidyl aminopeptidase/acylaminoacyl peptidase